MKYFSTSLVALLLSHYVASYPYLIDKTTLFMLQVLSMQEIHDGLDFSCNNNDDNEDISIFSVKFSTDGRELVAASGDGAIYVYDLAANKVGLQIPAHEVCQLFNGCSAFI